jgi:DNA-binding transcriptional regulator YhcF (GntR family)
MNSRPVGDERGFMQIVSGVEKPIFIQLAEAVEDNILKGIYAEETQIPSTTEVSVTLKVNPATVNRGVNLLVDEGIIYKKRGVGMFVSSGARAKILARRKQAFYESFLLPLLEEARNLGFTRQDVVDLLKNSAGEEAAQRSSSNEQH